MEGIFPSRKRLLIAFKETFTSTEGKKVLETIGQMCGKDESTFDQCPITMAYRAAKRDAYLEILKLVNFEIKTNHKNKTEDSDQAQTVVDEESEDPLN